MDYVELESGARFTVAALCAAAGAPSEFEDFVAGLQERDQQKLYTRVRVLAERGSIANETQFRALCEGLFEVKSGQDRAIWFYWHCPRTGRSHVMITHGFRKRSRRTPRREIEKAQRDRSRFLQAFGGC